MDQNHKQSLLWLDLLRGLAALVVMAGHLRSVMFVDFESLLSPGLPEKAFYFVTGFGHQAVIIFFVLSGFFIIRSVHQSLMQEKWTWRVYFINRLTRLWTVLIPGLVLGFFWDKIGLALDPTYEVYTGIVDHLVYFDPNGKLNLFTLLGNLVFVQTIFVETFGTNGALWSLSNEFWYYIAFPLIYVGFRTRKALWGVVLGISIIVCFDYFALDNATHPALYFGVWLLGGIAFWLSSRLSAVQHRGLYALLVALLLLLVLAGIRGKSLPVLFNDYSLGLVTMLLVALLSSLEMRLSLVKITASFLSSISYTLYVVHLPLAVFCSAFFFEQRATFTNGSVGIYMLVFAIILFYAWVVYFLFERNTDRIKRLLLRH